MGDTKGLSPLIATVVFIAFVVAFLALIVSAIITMTGGDACERVEIEIRDLNDLPTVCRDTVNLKLVARNTGKTDIGGIRFIFTGSTGSTEEDVMTPLEKESDAEYTVGLPKELGRLTEITLIPLGKDGEMVCEDSTVPLNMADITECK